MTTNSKTPGTASLAIRPIHVLGIFSGRRLQAYGNAIAAGLATLIFYLFVPGHWLLGKDGFPVYHDFTCDFVAGFLALHGNVASIYVLREFIRAQQAIVGAGRYVSPIWPYPPSFLLILAPFAALPYIAAFLAWAGATLLGYVAVVHRIVRRPPAIALALASPFAVMNFLGGQSGALTASLFGASLLALERRPALAGALIGCLSYKPQFGILFPVALVAARQWRAFLGAAMAAVVTAAVSAVVFGPSPWVQFPGTIVAQAHMNLVVGPSPAGDIGLWGLVQTVFGLVRRLGGSAALAWAIQGAMTLGLVVVVSLIWRSRTRYALKAATLSAAALLATPYAFCYSLTAVAIPVAFLVRDQIEHGLLRGEQTALLVLAAASFLVLATLGKAPVGAVVVLALLCLTLRRISDPGVWVRSAPGTVPRPV